MAEIPPFLEKILDSLGINTNRLKWKLRYWEQDRQRRQAARERSQGALLYKACSHCGHLALADDKVCKCGRPLPSYAAYRATRLLSHAFPGGRVVSGLFVSIIWILFIGMALLQGWTALKGPNSDSFLAFGGFTGGLFQEGQYWRAFSMALIHFGILHILFNSMALTQMLPHFESDVGPWRTLTIITLTQIGAVIAHMLNYGPNIPTGGASGVAFGLIGFGVVYSHRLRRYEERAFFIQWMIYGLLFGFLVRSLHINNAAHIGGMLAGLPLGWWMAGREPRGLAARFVKVTGMACLAIWLVTAAFLVFSIINHARGLID